MKTKESGMTTDKMVGLLLVIIVIAVAISIVVWRTIIKIDSDNPVAVLEIDIGTSYGNPYTNELGGITYSIWGRWGKKQATMFDNSFDGTLDKVGYTDENSHTVQWVYPGSSDWNIWIERFNQVRTEAAIGKRIRTITPPFTTTPPK
jgi:hypothetical protein